MKTKEQLRKKLSKLLPQFIGSVDVYKYSPLFPNLVLTEGVKALAEVGECFWLIDQIASLQAHSKIKANTTKYDLQYWTLKVNHQDCSASLTCNTQTKLYSERIEYTDFALDKITLVFGHSEFTNGRPYQIVCLMSER